MGEVIISIKTSVREHFSENPFSRHLVRHFSQSAEIQIAEISLDTRIFEMREFILEDADKCAELYIEVFTAYPWYDDWISFNQVRYYLEELTENPVFKGFVAYENDDMVAACLGHRKSWWTGKEFFIDEFYVKNQRQGNGIGSALLNFVEDELTKKGYGRLVLTTDREIPAENFYKKFGFNNMENRTVMVKEL